MDGAAVTPLAVKFTFSEWFDAKGLHAATPLARGNEKRDAATVCRQFW